MKPAKLNSTPWPRTRVIAAGLALASGLTTEALAQATSPTADTSDDTVTLSEFHVNTAQDKGYRASNSVSGSRFNTPIKDLPFALQAFTADFINDIRPTNLYDLALYSPGVSYRSSDFTNGNAELAIRGFNVAAGSLTYSSQTLRDGMKGPPIFAFANIERVEVVKGPASFLYGQLAPGGMVNLITKAPKEKFETTITATYGSYNQYSGLVDTTGPIGGGFFYRVVGSYSQDVDYWDPYDSHETIIAPQLLYKLNDKTSLSLKFEKFEKRESPQLFQKPQWGGTRSGLPSWAADQADPLVANAVIPAGVPRELITSNDPNLAGIVVPGLPRDFNQMADSDYRNSDDTAFSATLDVEANEHWSVRAAYAHDLNIIDMVFSGRPPANPNINAYTAAYNAALAAGMTAAQAEAAAFPNSGFAQGRRWRWQNTRRLSDSIEGQALGKYNFGGVSLKLLLGAQYNPYSARQKNGQAPDSTNPAYNPAGPLPPWDLRDSSTWNRTVPSTFSRDVVSVSATNGLPQSNNDITKVTDQAIYAGSTWGFFKDDLLILAGIRRTYSSQQTEHDHATLATTPPSIGRTIDPEFKTEKNTPQVGVLYKVLPEVTVFASYAESFVPQAGNLSVIDRSDPNNWTTVAGAQIQPTVGKGYDVGIKTDLFNGRVSSTITYFEVQNENIVVSVPQTGPNGIFFPTFQAGLQESKGVEADITYSPTDNWQIYASASIMNAQTVYVITEEEDARLLAINTLAGYQALAATGEQTNWRNVWNQHGKPLQMTAPHTYNLWTKYNFTGALKGFFVGGGFNNIRNQTIFQQMDPRYRQTYTLWNAMVGYSAKVFGYPTTFTLSGKNLSDEDYLPSQNTQSRPREVIFSVTTKF